MREAMLNLRIPLDATKYYVRHCDRYLTALEKLNENVEILEAQEVKEAQEAKDGDADNESNGPEAHDASVARKLFVTVIADLELWNRVRLYANAVNRRLSSTEQLATHWRLTYSLKTVCRETASAEKVFASAANDFRELRLETALRNYEASGNRKAPIKLPTLSCGITIYA